MNVHVKLSAPQRGAEHYNQVPPASKVRKSLDTTVLQTVAQSKREPWDRSGNSRKGLIPFLYSPQKEFHRE
jgi:hypothetical protein